jgi:hypothetical protein
MTKGIDSVKTPEDVRDEFVAEFMDLRDSWNSQIPDEIKGSVGKDTRYKARNAWFELTGGLLDSFFRIDVESFVVPEEIFELWTRFDTTFRNVEFSNRLTTCEDIDLADAMINEAIMLLEQVEF